MFAAIPLCTAAQQITREEYIDRYKSIAVAHMERYGIPASITMAQGLLESNAGNSWLSRQSNNHFGIKCKRDWTGDRVYHDDDAKGECFRSYPTVEDSYDDHARFLDSQPRYDSLFAEIAREAVQNGQISTSMIQRNYEVGFNRAGRIMTQLERAGIVGRQQGAKPRDILFHDLPSLEAKLQDLGLF